MSRTIRILLGLMSIAAVCLLLTPAAEAQHRHRGWDRDGYWDGYWSWYDGYYRPYYSRRHYRPHYYDYGRDYSYYRYPHSYYDRYQYHPHATFRLGPYGFTYWH